jgi:DNA-binding NtrC family response regulator
MTSDELAAPRRGELRFRPGAMPPLFGDTASVLIVDDDEIVTTILVRLLGRAGYRCTCARDAVAARACLATGAFALALIDVMMPGESGLELAEAILEEYPEVSVVMVTGIDDPNVAESAFESGAYGYVVKPFRPPELLLTVANAGRRRCHEIAQRAYQKRLEVLVDQQARELEILRLSRDFGPAPDDRDVLRSNFENL